jgi:protein LSM14
MAKLDTSATLQQAESNGMDNLAKKVQEMRVNAARTSHGNRGDRADRADRGGRGRGGPRPAKVDVPDADFDFASANAKFNKQDLVKEAIAGSPLTEAPVGNVVTSDTAEDAPVPVEPAYNKNKSFFDNISREAKDKENPTEKLGGRQWREEQTRKNIETFGQGSVDGGHRGYGRGRGRGRGGRGRGHRGGRGGGGYRQREGSQQAAQ